MMGEGWADNNPEFRQNEYSTMPIQNSGMGVFRTRGSGEH